MMASEGSPSAVQPRLAIDLPIEAPEGTTVETDEVLSVIKSLKKVFASKRADYVQKKAEENAQKLYDVTKNLFKLSTERRNPIVHGADNSIDLLSKRQQDAIDMQNGIDSRNGDNDNNGSEDDGYASSEILLGSSIAVKNAVCPIKLPEVKRLPRYTTWIFLDRNQRMTEDQSVVGRRRIYYDQNSGEAIICSDSEEELLEEKDEKREFVESEDVILCSTIQQVGLSDRVLDLLGQCLSRKPREVKARYEELVKDENACSSKNENIQGALNLFLDKDLDAALDSFDILFCRRCLVFDCKSHGCSQDLIFTAEKQLPWYSPDVDKDSPDVDKEPCCPNCYLLAITKENKARFTSPQFANHGENPVRPSEINGDKPWRSLEKALFEKGLEMFGRSSCMIARNLMNGWRTCWEVFQYMENFENELSQVGDDVNGMLDCSFKGDGHTIMGDQPHKTFKFLHRRGRARRLKYSGKLAGYRALRKRISGRKDQLNRQYNPCNCQAPCGKECPCIVNRTCCEKYCGCPKSCKNRFRGCLCVKNQCRSRQCACFAADRECDPDVCRNCWISCGDGTLGFPSQRGDKNECNNMKLLLKQHQRVLLGRSDVSGWGAFLKNSVEKNEFLGEYTGEIISHDEAERRGKIYDLENSSFLFNLTDQFVLDAYRKGNKLKFANHSPDPNCYPKIIKVAGDYKVGIFAKEKIFAGEELFYDYGYDPDTTHAWARKPEASTTRKFFFEYLLCPAAMLSFRFFLEDLMWLAGVLSCRNPTAAPTKHFQTFFKESFQLVSKFVLYAYRKGDKLKFTDHSPDPNFYTTRLLWLLEITGLVYLPKKEFVQERNCSLIIIMSWIQHLPGAKENCSMIINYHLVLRNSLLPFEVPCFLTDSFFFQQDVICIDHLIDLLIHFIGGQNHCICRITYQIMFGSLTRLLSMPCSR